MIIYIHTCVETLAATLTKKSTSHSTNEHLSRSSESGDEGKGIRLSSALTETLERPAAIITGRITRTLLSGTCFRLRIGTNTTTVQTGKLICLTCGLDNVAGPRLSKPLLAVTSLPP